GALNDALREREDRIERLRRLDHTEVVFALKDTVGMEAIRPLRGALYERSARSAFLLDHTLQIAFALSRSDNQIARAAFGLLVSAIPSYILQLFPTNAHATREEILRTPIPHLSDDAIAALDRAATATQKAGEKLHAFLASRGGELRLATISIFAADVLRQS